MKNIGLMLTTKTNKTEPYWKNQQPQTVLARPGSVLAPQGPAEHPVLVPAGARSRGPALGTRGAPRGFCAGPVCAAWGAEAEARPHAGWARGPHDRHLPVNLSAL